MVDAHIPKFDKNHVQYVHDQDKTVIGFDIEVDSMGISRLVKGEPYDFNEEASAWYS